MAMNQTAANMQQLMNKNQPLMNPSQANQLQQLTNSMQQLLNPTPTPMQLQLNNPTPTAMQQLASPAPPHMQQLINPPHDHMNQHANPNPTPMQQLMNQSSPAKQQLLKQNPLGARQLIKGDRHLFSSSDDNAMSKQIQATHSPDGRQFDVKPLLHIVEDIFYHSAPTTDSHALPTATRSDALDERTYHSGFSAMLESLAFVIDRVASELTYKCTSGGDAHSTTMAILNMLSSYTWDAKLVIALAAFAMNYGEFWLVAQNYTSNQLAKSVAILKQLPDILENSSMLKPRFDSVKNLITVMLAIAKCIVEFHELPHMYITTDTSAFSTAIAHLPIAVYWTIRSIVACASQITGLIGLGHEHMVSTTEAWELSSLAHKLSNIHSHLANQLGLCFKHIDERKQMETYQNLLHLFDMAHLDNMRVLKALIYAKDDVQPLVEGSSKRKVNIEVLRRKNVLLLISDLDITQEEISILEQIYNESRLQPSRQESQYEIVWLPILDHTVPLNDATHKKFEMLQSSMTWYSVYSPTLIDQAVVQFIKKEWHFNKKPMLVVLDPQGRIACPNALHMMWIWGSLAFPFTTLREEALWKEESWRLELLVDGIDPTILNWMQEGRYICLYGGEDMEWIRKFTNNARAVAQAAGIPLGMVYVGKSNPKERVRKNIATITVEKLSHCWQDLTSIWYFWVRIESMWRSKNQLGKASENDSIMKEIMTLLSFDSSEGGWAMLSRGADEIVKAKGSIFLTSLTDYTAWKDEIQQKGFLPSLRDYLKGLHTEHHCNRLILPGAAGKIPERIVCSECGRTMERFLLYKCCDE
ncbi:protein SIEVE ELEMENT OCCLUSION B-like [Mercurialis annua]|uniref:protein SIEVE ELEMENT OCCLUSION B-like n=1 Tax=Mercurialis annua TaxID=3986 RepID=UPI0021603C45|nr:protein SIEVE ELEMENT OCCLUSION B-like [Mercurialis annua]